MTISRVIDQHFMHRALYLAALGRYTTTPNPNVGCVIVSQQRIVGEGFHQQAGGPHAEVHALQQAGASAYGATAYVTLEPCSHFGRTPPCANALIAANIARVVIAMQDPNPQVAGRGIQQLKDAGIEVVVGVLEFDALALNRGFIKRMTSEKPWITTKLASSLDGRTALSNGKSQWITGEQARRDVHQLRAEYCAILTGADTILIDDPQLNVRLEITEIYPAELLQQAIRQPVKVIIDSKSRLHPELQVFQMAGDVIIANCEINQSLLASDKLVANVLQWQIPRNGQYLDLNVLTTRLAEHGFNQVWCEAGAKLNGAMLQANLIDEVVLYQAPKFMGPAAMPLCDLPEYVAMDTLPELLVKSIEKIGTEIKIVLSPQANLN